MKGDTVNKPCPRCGEVKRYSAFGRNQARPDGMSFYCLSCARERSRDYYRLKQERLGRSLREPDNSPEGYKRCSDCRVTKPLDAFHRHHTQFDGYNTYCKECRSRRGAETHLKRMYGLTRAELEALVGAQGGLCAICESKPAAHVDHDHVSGKIRGVLCFTCNVALGQLKDDVALFRKAIDYLERTTWQKTLESPGVYRLTSPRPAAAASSSSSALLRPPMTGRG